MYKAIKLAFAAGVVALLSSGSAMALTMVDAKGDCSSDFFGVSTLPGAGTSACGQAANRKLVANININPAGAYDGNFYSLGLGGTLALQFSPNFTGPNGTVVEVTNPSSRNYPEGVDIFVSSNGISWTKVDTVINTANQTSPANDSYSFLIPGAFSWLGFVDISASLSNISTDGFDIAQIFLREAPGAPVVPLPASLPLLGSAVGLLGLNKWRRKRKLSA